MIGWKTRVLLRHYIEKGMTKTAVAEMLGVGRRTSASGAIMSPFQGVDKT